MVLHTLKILRFVEAQEPPGFFYSFFAVFADDFFSAHYLQPKMYRVWLTRTNLVKNNTTFFVAS
jgi:hypothetical protein